jgi:hypothetical protein
MKTNEPLSEQSTYSNPKVQCNSAVLRIYYYLCDKIVGASEINVMKTIHSERQERTKETVQRSNADSPPRPFII